jgi:flagellar protein FliS
VQSGVFDADPHTLVQMLLDAAMERMSAAVGCIERGETVRRAKLLHSCVNLIAELRGTLNMDKGGALAQNLSELYEYMVRRLLAANASGEAAPITEVAGLLGEIRGAWIAIGAEVRRTPTAA